MQLRRTKLAADARAANKMAGRWMLQSQSASASLLLIAAQILTLTLSLSVCISGSSSSGSSCAERADGIAGSGEQPVGLKHMISRRWVDERADDNENRAQNNILKHVRWPTSADEHRTSRVRCRRRHQRRQILARPNKTAEGSDGHYRSPDPLNDDVGRALADARPPIEPPRAERIDLADKTNPLIESAAFSSLPSAHPSGARRPPASSDSSVDLDVLGANSIEQQQQWQKPQRLHRHRKQKRLQLPRQPSNNSHLDTQVEGELDRESYNGQRQNRRQHHHGRREQLDRRDNNVAGRWSKLAEQQSNAFLGAPNSREAQNFAQRQSYNGENIKTSLFAAGVENPQTNTSHRLGHKNSHWCHRDCSNIRTQGSPEDRVPICASDGRLYGSLCELRQRSCHSRSNLFQRPLIYCPQALNLVPSNGSEEVRIVELKRSCDKREFNEMKLRLVKQFNGDLDSMFRYFDLNGDNRIEAHELWPRDDAQLGHQLPLYARVWDEHSSRCSHLDRLANGSLAGFNQPAGADQSSCWFFLDFVFEPQFESNPCSLSHLMLFDLKHPSFNFSRSAFELAFAEVKERIQLEGSEPLRLFSQLNIPLGESATLNCLQNGFFNGSENSIDEYFELHREDVKCLWTRYNTNLAALQDPHVAVERRTVAAPDSAPTAPNRRANFSPDLLLRIIGAQLYTSGQFKCVCHLNKISRNFEHIYDVRVIVEPRVSVWPKSQRSLANSRVSFECQYDYILEPIDIQTNSQSPGQLEWQDKRQNALDASPAIHNATGANRQADSEDNAHHCHSNELATGRGQFGLRIKWLKDYQELINDSNKFKGLTEADRRPIGVDGPIDLDSSAARSAGDTRRHVQVSDGDDDDQTNERRDVEDANSEWPSEAANTLAAGYTRAEAAADEAQLANLEEEKSPQRPRPAPSQSGSRASIALAASRLTLERVEAPDTGQYTCLVEAPLMATAELTNASNSHRLQTLNGDQSEQKQQQQRHHQLHYHEQQQHQPLHQHDRKQLGQSGGVKLSGSSQASLLVEEAGASGDADGPAQNNQIGAHLWLFHDNGISIYKLANDDSQEMDLLREINGHSLVSAEVDGNWNQLTLCGGINPEQVVICEWSDNALHIDVIHDGHTTAIPSRPASSGSQDRPTKYVYVGQPNLNRVIIMDGSKFEIVAIINTEPQPRKLFHYKPNRIHLSKWVRRRMSPAVGARWLAEMGTSAHQLRLTPNSKLYSRRPEASIEAMRRRASRTRRFSSSAATNQPPSKLIQHDIWLLCYGQPLVVEPAANSVTSREPLLQAAADVGKSNFYPTKLSGSDLKSTTNGTNVASRSRRSAAGSPTADRIQPFTPRLSAGGPFAWSIWSNKESRLRNRKSVHIIQSTFFPRSSTNDALQHDHEQELDHEHQQHPERQTESGAGQTTSTSTDKPAEASSANFLEPSRLANLYEPRARLERRRARRNGTVVGDFKRSTVITTHHVFPGIASQRSSQRYLNRAQFDLIQDLHVPQRPNLLADDKRHQIHYAYVTHYDEDRLFRVSMDEYRYDREVYLQSCDPINLMTTGQGLLVVQCRAPITHNLTGQLVLDQLTSSQIEFNANIRAQESHISPDHRYLISIYTNASSVFAPTSSPASASFSSPQASMKVREGGIQNQAPRGSIIYVQLVTTSGLKFQYEIKTLLEISQCSFVWKDGYYSAILVSTNMKDQQSEIFSLRLSDGRLELMARVAGVQSLMRRKDQLVVAPELRLAALSTNQGTFVVDLEDNRVLQSLRHHPTPPTLLWV